MGVTLKQSTIAELESVPNIRDLLDEYARESAIAGLPHPSAKAQLYKQIEATGTLRVITAYVGETLVGFIQVLAPVLPHYDTLIATIESFFVAKEYRSTGAGLRLLHAAENYAREIGSPGLLISAPIGGKLAQVLSKSDYVETNRVFFKRTA